MQRIIISGENLSITTEELNQEVSLNVSKESMWFPDGVSRETTLVDGLQVHRFKPLEDFRSSLRQGDQFDRQVARELPDFVLMARTGVDYNAETAYQIFRNQQASFILGVGLFRAHKYGNYYRNVVTGERTKEPKGFNPYDDWERVYDETMVPLSNIMVASGGNHSQIFMPPWYTNVPAGTELKNRYESFLTKMMDRVKRQSIERAEMLRALDGKDNPISTDKG